MLDPRTDFGRQLDELRVAAGSPTLTALARYQRQDPNLWGRTQMRQVLDGQFVRVPEWERVWAFVQVCVLHAGDGATRQLRTLANEELWRHRHSALVQFLKSLPTQTHMPEQIVPVDRSDPLRVGVPPMLADQYQPRPTLTKELDRADSESATVAMTQVLSGAGGVGKTQLAAAYAHTRWPDRDVELAMWISARSRDTILSTYAQAAAELLGADQTDPDRAASRLLAWLHSAQRPWLIVLDDLRRPEDLQGLWPPANRHGQVVVTTRRRDPSLVRTDRILLDVGVFTDQEAHGYLHAKLIGQPHLVEGLQELALAVGYLPLALAQAAAYLINRDLTCHEYHERLADHRRTLGEVLPDPGELPDDLDQDQILSATFRLSVDLADTLSPVGVARPVMFLASLLDPAGIPIGVLTTEAVLDHIECVLGHSIRLDDTTDAIQVLHRLNLLTADRHAPGREVRVHALVQRATRESVARDDADLADASAKAAGDALMEVWPTVEHHSVLVHALRANAASLLVAAGGALWNPSMHPVLFRIGLSAGQAGLVATAASYFEHLFTLAKRQMGPDNLGTMVARNNFARWRGEAGDIAGAVTEFEQLVIDQLRVRGPDDFTTLNARSNLIRWRGNGGDVAGAIREAEYLLADQLRVLGPDHPDTLATRNNLGGWRGMMGDNLGAVREFELLLADHLRIFGPDHRDTLVARGNLAGWRGHAGNTISAVTEFQQLLIDHLRLLGPNDPDTLNARNNVAYWRANAGDFTGAVTEFEQLLVDQLRVLGPDHPNTLITRFNLATWRSETGDVMQAVDELTQLLVDQLRVLGPDHPHTLLTRHNLAGWSGYLGDAPSAVAELKLLLADRIRVLGTDHPHTLATRRSLASWLVRTGDLGGALTEYLQVSTGELWVPEPDRPDLPGL